MSEHFVVFNDEISELASPVCTLGNAITKDDESIVFLSNAARDFYLNEGHGGQ